MDFFLSSFLIYKFCEIRDFSQNIHYFFTSAHRSIRLCIKRIHVYISSFFQQIFLCIFYPADIALDLVSKKVEREKEREREGEITSE